MDKTGVLFQLIFGVVLILLVSSTCFYFHLRLLRLEKCACAAASAVVLPTPDTPPPEDQGPPAAAAVGEEAAPAAGGDVIVVERMAEEECPAADLLSIPDSVAEEVIHQEVCFEEEKEEAAEAPVPQAAAEVDPENMSVAELRTMCDARGIAYNRKARKADLIAYVKSAMAA
jgi:hypothetical protein